MRKKALPNALGSTRAYPSAPQMAWGLVVIPIVLLIYVFGSAAPPPIRNLRDAVAYRHSKAYNISWPPGEKLQSIIQRVRNASSDQSIARLVTMAGLPLSRPSLLPSNFVALDADEHFYWPFMHEGYEHAVEELQLDRSIRLISRSDSPRVLEVHNFLSGEECDAIVAAGTAKGLGPSPLIMNEAQTAYDWSAARTSRSVFIKQWNDPLLDLFAQRAANLTRIPPHHSEEMQVVHYDKTQHYYAHFDWIGMDVPITTWPARTQGLPDNRYLTLLLYLNDVKDGGFTTFPRTNPKWSAEEHGFQAPICDPKFESLKIYPRKGNAVLFYNVLENEQRKGSLDEMSAHAGCDPVTGEKWVANFWIHMWPMREPQAPQSACTGAACEHHH